MTNFGSTSQFYPKGSPVLSTREYAQHNALAGVGTWGKCGEMEVAQSNFSYLSINY